MFQRNLIKRGERRISCAIFSRFPGPIRPASSCRPLHVMLSIGAHPVSAASGAIPAGSLQHPGWFADQALEHCHGTVPGSHQATFLSTRNMCNKLATSWLEEPRVWPRKSSARQAERESRKLTANLPRLNITKLQGLSDLGDWSAVVLCKRPPPEVENSQQPNQNPKGIPNL